MKKQEYRLEEKPKRKVKALQLKKALPNQQENPSEKEER